MLKAKGLNSIDNSSIENCRLWRPGSAMARELRVEFPGVIYDVMNRGDRRETIFRDEQPGTASGNDGRTHQGAG